MRSTVSRFVPLDATDSAAAVSGLVDLGPTTRRFPKALGAVTISSGPPPMPPRPTKVIKTLEGDTQWVYTAVPHLPTHARLHGHDGRVTTTRIADGSFLLRFVTFDGLEPIPSLTVDIHGDDVAIEGCEDMEAEGVSGDDTLRMLQIGLAGIPGLPMGGQTVFPDGAMPTAQVLAGGPVAPTAPSTPGSRRRRVLLFA